ncbi:uncharacterized protein METZ01_LOCUS256897, partial [marine metagenome]
IRDPDAAIDEDIEVTDPGVIRDPDAAIDEDIEVTDPGEVLDPDTGEVLDEVTTTGEPTGDEIDELIALADQELKEADKPQLVEMAEEIAIGTEYEKTDFNKATEKQLRAFIKKQRELETVPEVVATPEATPEVTTPVTTEVTTPVTPEATTPVTTEAEVVPTPVVTEAPVTEAPKGKELEGKTLTLNAKVTAAQSEKHGLPEFNPEKEEAPFSGRIVEAKVLEVDEEAGTATVVTTGHSGNVRGEPGRTWKVDLDKEGNLPEYATVSSEPAKPPSRPEKTFAKKPGPPVVSEKQKDKTKEEITKEKKKVEGERKQREGKIKRQHEAKPIRLMNDTINETALNLADKPEARKDIP